MISVEEAKELIRSSVSPLGSVKLPVASSQGYALSNDIHAPISLPSFRQSAMDGYAVRLKNGLDSFECIGEVAAGSSVQYSLKEGQGVRIFTGAAVPDSANCVVMQEWVNPLSTDEPYRCEIDAPRDLRVGDHIRPIGEQVNHGELVFSKGTVINGGVAGLLKSFGISEIEVTAKPRIGVVVTGDELVQSGESLKPGQIYESNSVSIQMTLIQQGFEVNSSLHIKDDYQELLDGLSDSMKNNDVLIVSGGISVGDYDLVGTALKELGVKEVFYKVKQKPGKPLFFGKLGEKLIFGLPGNPAASVTCILEYVTIALKLASGYETPELVKIMLPLEEDFVNKGDRAKFLKACVSLGGVKVLGGQASSMLKTFSDANALVYIPSAESSIISKGTLVEVHLY